MEKTINFLNNQRYVLGENKKIKILFFYYIDIIEYFRGKIGLYIVYIIFPLILLISFILDFFGVNDSKINYIGLYLIFILPILVLFFMGFTNFFKPIIFFFHIIIIKIIKLNNYKIFLLKPLNKNVFDFYNKKKINYNSKILKNYRNGFFEITKK